MFDRKRARRSFGRRSALHALCLLMLLALLPQRPASDQPADRLGGARERFEERHQRHDAARQDHRRDESREQRRRHLEERRERMTPEERRSLRRDLHEARRDLYRQDR